MSIRRRLVPVFAILIAGILLRILRTAYGLEWNLLQKVVYLVIASLVITFLGNAVFKAIAKRRGDNTK